MTEPKVTIEIKINRIAIAVLDKYELTKKEKLHFDKFISDYCKATEKYLEKNSIKGEVKFIINYGK